MPIGNDRIGAKAINLDLLGVVMFECFKLFDVLSFWEGSQDVSNSYP